MASARAVGAAKPRKVLFFRDFRAFTGGHLKVWNYFQHVASSRGFVPQVYFAPGSRLDDSNPWVAAGIHPEHDWRPEEADVLFIGGTDWEWVDSHPAGTAGRPVLNIVQGLRHADPADCRYAFLQRPAIRLAVNTVIVEALAEVPGIRGPVLHIPMGMDLPAMEVAQGKSGVVIAALKDPAIGRALAQRLHALGVGVRLLDVALPRSRYLAEVASAAILVCLPLPSEGFYLPALEGMALGCIVICPDCGGNQAYLRPWGNALQAAATPEGLSAAVQAALALGETESMRMRMAAIETARTHSIDAERAAFHGVLRRVDQLWGACA